MYVPNVTLQEVEIDGAVFAAKVWKNPYMGKTSLGSTVYKMQEYTTRNGRKRLRKIRISPVFQSEIYEKAMTEIKKIVAVKGG